MAEYIIQDTTLEAIANAINAKTGGTSSMTPAEMVTEIGSIPTSGSDPYEIALAMNNNTLTSFDVPLQKVADYMFYGMTNLTDFDFSEIQEIGEGAFRKSGVKDLSASGSVTIKASAFYGSNLETVDLPDFTGNSFDGLFRESKIGSLILPKVTTAGLNWLRQCLLLTSVVLPSCNLIGQYFTYGSSRLTSVDIGGDNLTIQANAFNNTLAFNTLIIRGANVATLQNVNALGSTPFVQANKTATLYVPNSMISSYQQASNWSTILATAGTSIFPIEGSIYETQYADGTPIPSE